MSWYVSFFAALAVLAAAMVVRLCCRKIKTLHICIAAVLGVLMTLGGAPYYALTNGHVAESVVQTFTQSLRAFTGEADYGVMRVTIHMAPAWMRTPYSYLLLAVQMAAPFLTVGFMLSLFKNISARLRLFLSRFRDIYVFSQLNERSLTMAKDLHKNHPKAKIFFADVYDTEDDAMAELALQVKEIGGVCFKQSITSIPFRGQKGKVTFFAIHDDESQNIHQSMKLLERYNHYPNTHLYLFSTGTEGEVLLSGMERGTMKVRRVHVDRSLVFRLLYEQGASLFDSAVNKEITAVVVGLDGRGMEMLKALSWFGQMDGYKLTIHAFDGAADAQSVFTAQCPELMSMSGKQIPGESEYEIHIHGACPVDSQRFAQEILNIDATWVFVSSGSDEENIRIAAMLRTQFRRRGCNPQIRAVVADSGLFPALEKAANHVGQNYEIQPVGDLASCYTEAVIMQSDVEADAFRRHQGYCNGDADREEDFWRLEYCYRSSVASAIHATARRKCLEWAQIPESALTYEQRHGLEVLEHRRWNAYMRSEGYVYSENRDDLAKKHHNLVPFDALSSEDQRKDSRVAAENR